MALQIPREASGFLAGGKDNRPAWLEPLGKQLQANLTALVQGGGQPLQDVKDFLNGTWLGHPLHPALIVVPLGSWITATFLDVIGEEGAADAAIGVGLVSALPTAAAGAAQWHDTDGEQRRLGLVHAILNTAALGLYAGSLMARRSGLRGLGIGLSTVGLGVVGWSGYLGGELSYTLGVGVNRNAWLPEREQADRFQVAAKADGLVDGKLAAGEITVGGRKVPLVLLKRGEEILALGAVCSHMGGPLAEGKLVGVECVECPWHGSRFDMRDGSVVQSLATAPQPRFEARLRAGNVEVRRLS
jgi:nitrite reductase/ring-hydroxylating ferredoxin subunit/uncharacterized membrane protein